jgi:hypothetical protein
MGDQVNLSVEGKRKQLSDANRCVQHYYRPAKGKCSVCGSPLCEECMGTGSVAVCRKCFDNPLTQEERAAAESTGKLSRKARTPRKPPEKTAEKKVEQGLAGKAKKLVALRRKPPSPDKSNTRRISLGYSQKQALKYGALFVLAATAATLITLSLLHKSPFGVVRPKLAPQAQQKQLKGFVQFAVSRVEFYKQKNGKLPATLKDAGIADSAVYRYQLISADQYVLDATANGQSFTYNSNQDPQEVFGGP